MEIKQPFSSYKMYVIAIITKKVFMLQVIVCSPLLSCPTNPAYFMWWICLMALCFRKDVTIDHSNVGTLVRFPVHPIFRLCRLYRRLRLVIAPIMDAGHIIIPKVSS